MSTTRVYIVKSKIESNKEMLIQASNAGQALRHAIAGCFSVKPASGLEVAAIMENGGKLEKAGGADEIRTNQ